MKKISCTSVIQRTQACGEFFLCEFSSCKETLKEKYGGKISLVYLDPPFCTGNNFSFEDKTAYEDKLSQNDFIEMMRSALSLAYELLSDEGSVYLHIDYRTSARMRLLLDGIFGEKNFRNEIIWSYNSGGRSTKHFPRKHDTIYFYSKSDNYYFDIKSVGISRGTMRRNNMKKNVGEDGRVFFSINSNGKEYRYYEDDSIYPTDVWTDIEHLHQKDKERTSYPTQKPIKLLSRIISASTPEGAYICDLFSGSGTTAVAAEMLGRHWVAVDKSPIAAAVLQNRLRDGECKAVFNLRCDNNTDLCLCADGGCCRIDTDISEIMRFCSGYIEGETFYAEHCSTENCIKVPDCSNRAVYVTLKNGETCFYMIDGD